MKKKISIMLVLVLGLAAEVANADFIWGTPTNLGPEVNSSYGDGAVCISPNGLEFYFVSNRPGGYGDRDLWVMKRPTIEDDWGDPMNLGSPANSQYDFWEPSISSDGLSLYFSDGHTPQFGNRLPGGIGGQGDIWMITRETIQDAWGAPVNIGPAVNSLNALHPSLSADGLSLYFQSHGGGICDIMVATRESTSDSFGNPVKPAFLKNVNSSVGEWMPDISADGRMLFFNRIQKLWMSTRATIYDDFGPPVKLPPQLNISNSDSPSISPDGSTLYFTSGRPGGLGGNDIWQVSISPVIDFNGDGIIDAADMCIMVDHWGEDYPLCDIGPMPWGDGIVDVQDLIVLAEHLFEEIFAPELVAYWKLDEAEGNIAQNSTSDNHGILSGNPTWQPDSGHVAGTLEFDGINDHVITDFVLDPAGGAFSVFAWIKGGAPGQVIISQADGIGTGETWLGMDALGGNLMTGLRPPGLRSPTPPMVSDFVITDGQWHHVGIVVTTYGVRNLYADGKRVASDTQGVSLSSSDGGLYFGSGKTLEAGTFFSGLIDDVRIYNQSLSGDEIAALAQ